MSARAEVSRGPSPAVSGSAVVVAEPEGRAFFIVLGALVTVALVTLFVAVSTLVAAVLAA